MRFFISLFVFMYLNNLDTMGRVLAAEKPELAYDGVQLCKAMGRGFLLLPGSDTCVKISGIVRGQLDVNLDNATTKEESKSVLHFTFGSITAYGKLIGKISYEAAGNPARSVLKAKFSQGIIGLNRFKIGFSASNWVRYNWGGYNIKSGPFGYHKADMVAFEDTIMGVKLRVAAEYPENTHLQLPSMIGHISKGWKGFSLFASGVLGLDDGFRTRAIKAGVVLKLNKIKRGFRLKFQGTFGEDVVGKYLEGERWDFIAALSFPITRTLNTNITFGTSDIFAEKFSIAGNLVWRPVRKFKIIGEVSYVQGGDLAGLVRVQRTF